MFKRHHLRSPRVHLRHLTVTFSGVSLVEFCVLERACEPETVQPIGIEVFLSLTKANSARLVERSRGSRTSLEVGKVTDYLV